VRTAGFAILQGEVGRGMGYRVSSTNSPTLPSSSVQRAPRKRSGIGKLSPPPRIPLPPGCTQLQGRTFSPGGQCPDEVSHSRGHGGPLPHYMRIRLRIKMAPLRKAAPSIQLQASAVAYARPSPSLRRRQTMKPKAPRPRPRRPSSAGSGTGATGRLVNSPVPVIG